MNKLKLRIITSAILIILVGGVYTATIIPKNNIVISTNSQNEVIYNGKKDSNNVSLMFNVYENTKTVNEILDVLKNKNAKATFFVGGVWVKDNAETIKRILEEGHELANHGNLHKDHKKISEEDNRNEITTTHLLVKSLTGYEMTLFAPPSGSFSKTTLKVAKELNYYTIMWSKDTIDWRDNDINLIIKRATSSLEGGDLILMHPKEHTKNALEKIIENIKNSNFQIVKVSQNIGLNSI